MTLFKQTLTQFWSKRRLFTLLSTIVLISSCVSSRTQNNDYRLEAITDINNEAYWDMQGRMTVRLGDGTSEKINMSWRQSGKRLTLEFSGTIKVQSDGSASITSANLNESAKSLEALWNQFSPLPLPISALSYWIKGERSPISAQLNTVENHDPKSKKFNQQNWEVSMSKYTTRKTYNMPNKIKLSNGSQSATIFIEQWTFY